MGQASIFMTLLVAGMGATWYSMETGMIGPGDAEMVVAAASDAALDAATDAAIATLAPPVAFQARADAALVETAD